VPFGVMRDAPSSEMLGPQKGVDEVAEKAHGHEAAQEVVEGHGQSLSQPLT